MAEFGGIDLEPGIVRGMWVHKGVRYKDELIRCIVDVPDTAKSRRFFVRYKEKLLQRFQQIEIYITSYPVDVI